MQNYSDSIDRKRSGREILSSLSDQDWKDLIDRLKLFFKSYYYNVDVEDLIMDAVTAVIAGKRRWDPTTPPFHNFCSIIRSVASNKLEKEKRFTSLTPDNETSRTHDVPLNLPSIPSHAEAYEQRENDEVFRSRLEESLKDDALALHLADSLIDDPEVKPEQIAEDLGEEKKKVYNARKRLFRKLKALMEVH